MAFKFANEIINEIKTRGSTEIPVGSVSGEEFEEWLYTEGRKQMTEKELLDKANDLYRTRRGAIRLLTNEKDEIDIKLCNTDWKEITLKEYTDMSNRKKLLENLIRDTKSVVKGMDEMRELILDYVLKEKK